MIRVARLKSSVKPTTLNFPPSTLSRPHPNTHYLQPLIPYSPLPHLLPLNPVFTSIPNPLFISSPLYILLPPLSLTSPPNHPLGYQVFYEATQLAI